MGYSKCSSTQRYLADPFMKIKLWKDENQSFTEFKYLEKTNYMVCILNMGSSECSDHHQRCENAIFKFVHHNTHVPVSLIFTVVQIGQHSYNRWTL